MIPNIIIYVILGVIVLLLILMFFSYAFGMYETSENENSPTKKIYDPLSKSSKMYSLPSSVNC